MAKHKAGDKASKQDTKRTMAQAKVMDRTILARLVGQLASANAGSAYNARNGKAASNTGIWVNCVYPKGGALNDVLRGQGFDPIASVEGAVRFQQERDGSYTEVNPHGTLARRPAGGHSVSVCLAEHITQPAATKPSDTGERNMSVARSFFGAANKAAKKASNLARKENGSVDPFVLFLGVAFAACIGVLAWLS